MAFNPFHTFRKHQKVIFAVLTILCMFVFIFTGFQGRNIFADWIGGRQSKGDKIAALYGRDVTSGDVDRLLQTRKVANDFLLQALESAAKDANKNVEDYKPEKPDETDDALKGLQGAWKDRDKLFQFNFGSDIITRIIRERVEQANALQMKIEAAAAAEGSDKSKTREQKQVCQDLRLLFKFLYFNLTRSADAFYFGGGVKPEDLLDFAVWKNQADQLDVVLTRADARRAVAEEAAGRGLPADPGGSWREEPAFKDFFKAHEQLPADQVEKAVADEFRVLIAKDLLGGRITGVPASEGSDRLVPDPVTPYDFWKFYRDRRATLKVAFLPVPVDAFLEKVTEQPGEEELRDLFAQYKSKEPVPDAPTPGFKEPRRVKIEYVTAQADTPYYKTRVQAAAVAPQVFYATAGLGAHLAGGGVGAQAALAEFVKTDELEANYEAVHSSYDASFLDQNKPAAAAAACLFGSGFGGALDYTAPAVALQAVRTQETADNQRQASVAFRMALSDAVAGTPFAGVGLLTTWLPTPFARETTLQQLWEKRQKDLGPRIVENDLGEFGKELVKLKNDPEKAKDFILKAVKERGWQLHDNAGVDDVYALEDDAALREVKDAVESFLQMQNQNPRQALPTFAKVVFDSMPAGTYQPHTFADGAEKQLTFWFSRDDRARELSFEEAEPRVREAWKYQKARVLALREASRIETEAAAQANPDEGRKKLVEQQKLGEVFDLGGVARLAPDLVPDQGHTATYHAYTFPEAKIPAGPDDLLDRLLTLDKPGKTLIFKDKPAKRFYVAVLLERPPLDMRDPTGFKTAFDEATQDQKDQLWRRYFLPNHRKEYHENLMHQLREEADPTNQKGEWVLAAKPGQQGPTQGQQPQPNPSDGGEGIDFGD